MTVTEESRHRLHQSLEEAIGPEEATTLMEHLPPVGWADVATKADLAHLQQVIDTRFALIDGRFDTERAHIDTRFALIDGRFDIERAHIDGRFDVVDERFAAIDQRFVAIDQRFVAVDQRFVAVDQRFGDLVALVQAMDTRLAHQFWQFLAIIVAFGAVVVGILRYTS